MTLTIIGIVVSLLINALVPDTIPTANLHFHLDLTHSTVATSRASTSQQTLKTRFEVGENLTACVAGAQKLAKSMHGSIVVVNFGASDLLEMNPGPVLGLGMTKSAPLRE